MKKLYGTIVFVLSFVLLFVAIGFDVFHKNHDRNKFAVFAHGYLSEDSIWSEVSTRSEDTENTSTYEEVCFLDNIELSVYMFTNSMSYEDNYENYYEETAVYVASESQNVMASSTSHTHCYTTEVELIYHPQEGHFETMCVKEAYVEEVYEDYGCFCYECGAIMDDWDGLDIMAHSTKHGSYGYKNCLVDTIEHEAEFEKIWVVDVEEYYEEVIITKCDECGYVG